MLAVEHASALPAWQVGAILSALGWLCHYNRHARPARHAGDMMNDAQVAAVVNHLRTHFGNNYSDVMTAQDVTDTRR